jgi:hypothetical protein
MDNNSRDMANAEESVNVGFTASPHDLLRDIADRMRELVALAQDTNRLLLELTELSA